MAQLEKVVYEDFDALLERIEDGIINGSASATLEESCDLTEGNARCSVRVFERYSYVGGNRVSLNVTLFRKGTSGVHVFAAATGGSQAVLFKLNTFGEEAFLEKLEELLED